MIRKSSAILILLCLTSMLVFAQTNSLGAIAAGGPAGDVRPGFSARELYEMLTIGAAWAMHANWGKILSAYEWVGDQGGIWGIICRFFAGKKSTPAIPSPPPV